MNSTKEKKRERLGGRSLFWAEHRGGAGRLVGDVCGNHHEFRLLIVLGKLDLGLARPELAASGIAFRPNLIKKIVVAQALKQKLGSGRGLSLLACV